MANELIEYECFCCGNFVVRLATDPDDAHCTFCGGAATERGIVSSFGQEEWQVCDSPYVLRQALRVRCRPISSRKARLLRCEISRRVYGWCLDELLWELLQTAEQFAEGRIPESDRQAMHDRWRNLTQSPEFESYPVWFSDACACIRLDDDDLELWPGDNARIKSGSSAERRVTNCIASHCYREMLCSPFLSIAFDHEWRTSTVALLSQGIYEERTFDNLPILADALQDAGCENTDILNHFRDPNATHVRGCWALDLVLGKS